MDTTTLTLHDELDIGLVGSKSVHRDAREQGGVAAIGVPDQDLRGLPVAGRGLDQLVARLVSDGQRVLVAQPAHAERRVAVRRAPDRR